MNKTEAVKTLNKLLENDWQLKEESRLPMKSYVALRFLLETPIVVPKCVDADTANRLYGEAYTVDWVYETEGEQR